MSEERSFNIYAQCSKCDEIIPKGADDGIENVFVAVAEWMLEHLEECPLDNDTSL